MAENKNPFIGLVKIQSANYSTYENLKAAGKLIFADISTGEQKGKYIYANGVEYKVADATNLDELIRRVEDVSQYAIDASAALADLSTFIRAKVIDLSTHVRTVTDASVTALESWKSTHADPSLNAFDASLKDHETRINNLEDASDALGQRIANVSQNVIDISTYVHTTVNASIDAIHTKDNEQDTSINDISSRLASVAIKAADNSIGVNNTSIALDGDNYVDLTATGNTVTASIKEDALVKGSVHTTDVSLATKGYVDDQIAALESALELKGDVASAESLDGFRANGSKGDVYVASATFKYPANSDPSTFIESGDLVIFKTNAEGGTPSDYFVVERNLDGAVTAAVALDNDYVILGSGNQAVKVSTIEVNALLTAIANANSALQTISANTSTGDYVTIAASKDASNANVSVGVIVATLADASDGGATFKALADARNVYEELTRVEEVTATSITTMADSIGLGSGFEPNWSQGSGINDASSYREVIEELHGQVAGHVVNSFDGKTGAISIDKTTATDGSLNFTTDDSTLKGTVVGWSGLVDRVAAAETSIGDVSGRLNDLSTYVRQTVDASIDRLDASISALESWKNNSSFVNTVKGEAVIAGANTTFVYVNANPSDGDVKLTSGVTLANNTYGSTTATGLATDAYVLDLLAWAVITD